MDSRPVQQTNTNVSSLPVHVAVLKALAVLAVVPVGLFRLLGAAFNFGWIWVGWLTAGLALFYLMSLSRFATALGSMSFKAGNIRSRRLRLANLTLGEAMILSEPEDYSGYIIAQYTLVDLLYFKRIIRYGERTKVYAVSASGRSRPRTTTQLCILPAPAISDYRPQPHEALIIDIVRDFEAADQLLTIPRLVKEMNEDVLVKHYKHRFATGNLLRNGHLSAFNWLFKRYRLTPRGQRFSYQLNKRLEEARELPQQFYFNPRQSVETLALLGSNILAADEIDADILLEIRHLLSKVTEDEIEGINWKNCKIKSFDQLKALYNFQPPLPAIRDIDNWFYADQVAAD